MTTTTYIGCRLEARLLDSGEWEIKIWNDFNTYFGSVVRETLELAEYDAKEAISKFLRVA